MGTFGLCDYLNRRGNAVRLVNLALYETEETGTVFEHHMNLFQPTHVGLIFHWQETTEGVLSTAKQIKSYCDLVKIVCGGFTAGYFGESLLSRYRFIDYVVKWK